MTPIELIGAGQPFNWDLVVVATVAAIPATLAAWSARKSQLHTRSKNGGVGMNEDLLHLTDSFTEFKDEVRSQWRFHLGFHHADRDIASDSESRTATVADWILLHDERETK